MNTPTNTPTARDYELAANKLRNPRQIVQLTRQLTAEQLGKGTVDDIAYLIANGAFKATEA